jgi:hypothetical protein
MLFMAAYLYKGAREELGSRLADLPWNCTAQLERAVTLRIGANDSCTVRVRTQQQKQGLPANATFLSST